jgi:hypothetical protein
MPTYKYTDEKDGKDSYFDVTKIPGDDGACGFAAIYNLVGSNETGKQARKKGVEQLKKNISNPKVRNLIKSELKGFLTSGDENTQDLIRYKVITKQELQDIVVDKYIKSGKEHSDEEERLKIKYFGSPLPANLAIKHKTNKKSITELLLEEPSGITEEEKKTLMLLSKNREKCIEDFENFVNSKVETYINNAVAKSQFWLSVAGNSPGVLGALAEIHNINFRVFSTASGEMREISNHMSNYVTPIHSLRLLTGIDKKTGAEKSGYHFEVLQEVRPEEVNKKTVRNFNLGANKKSTQGENYYSATSSYTTSSSYTTTTEGDTVMPAKKPKKLTKGEEYRLKNQLEQNIAKADKAVSVTFGDARAARFASIKTYQSEIEKINDLLKNTFISKDFQKDLAQLLVDTENKLKNLQNHDNAFPPSKRQKINMLNKSTATELDSSFDDATTELNSPTLSRSSVASSFYDEERTELDSRLSRLSSLGDLEKDDDYQPSKPPKVGKRDEGTETEQQTSNKIDIGTDPNTPPITTNEVTALQQDYWMIDRLFRRTFNSTADVIDAVNTALKNIHQRHPNFPMALITNRILPFLRDSFESGPPGERITELRIKSVVAMLCAVAAIAYVAPYFSSYAMKKFIQSFVTEYLTFGIDQMAKSKIMAEFMSSIVNLSTNTINSPTLTSGAALVHTAVSVIGNTLAGMIGAGVTPPVVSFAYGVVNNHIGKKRLSTNDHTESDSDAPASKKRRK